jgi:Domain of unknown function (DUF4135)
MRSHLTETADEPCLPTQVVSAAIRRTRLKEPAASRSEPLTVSHPSHEAWLANLSGVRLERQVNNMIEALTRTFAHLGELPVERTSEIAGISDIEMLGSESHNGGRRPVLIRFSPHQAVVYKPVNLQIDHLVSSLLSDLASRVDGQRLFTTLGYAPLGKDYGFVAYASTTRSRLGKQAARRFYHRFGALVAVAYSLNITDLHMENVLAVDEHPVLIDFETALYRFPDSLRPVDITLTGLVEQPTSAAPNSGLQGGGACRRWGLSPGREQERPVVSYREPHLHLANRRSHRSGELIQPAEFRQDLLAGFELGYRLVQRHRDLLRQRIALSRTIAAPQARCFATTPLEALEEQLQRLSASDLREQQSVFEQALFEGS